MKKRKKQPIKRIEYQGKIIKYRLMADLTKKKNRIDKALMNKRITVWKDKIKSKDFCEKCGVDFRIRQENGKLRIKHPHHCVSEVAVRRNYPELIDDLMNGTCLCSGCHKLSPDSAHEGAMEFILWLEEHKPSQYEYLKKFLQTHRLTKHNQADNSAITGTSVN